MHKTFRLSFTLIALSIFIVFPLSAQPFFSIDFQGPGLGPGAVLMPGPVVLFPAAFMGVVATATTGMAELDALSYGLEPQIVTASVPTLFFSVDEWATGLPTLAPDVFSEGMMGNTEASADLFYGNGLPAPPSPAGCAVFGNSAAYDGNGLGLVEPNPPGVFLPDLGHNVDAAVFRIRTAGTPVYFSLDAKIADPLEPFPANSGTAAANGFFGSDVLVTLVANAAPVLWAPAATLGLSRKDDLDALILAENGDGVYTPSTAFYDWVGGNTDMLLFSVRRNSRIIGTLDSFYGIPIEEGDILAPPIGGATAPAIFMPAESLGLATMRCGLLDSHFADELDALTIK